MIPLFARFEQEKTLEEYEKEMAEKRKAMALNANATAARKVRQRTCFIRHP